MTDRLDPRLRDALIAIGSTPEDRDRREREMSAMIDKQVALLARERRIMRPMFVYLVLLCTAFLLIAGYTDDQGTRLWFGIQACFWFIFGALIVIRYHVNAARVELLSELKTIQIQLARLAERSGDTHR